MDEERKRREGSAHTRTQTSGEGLRILRLAEALNLSSATLDEIRRQIFGEAGRSVSKVEIAQTEVKPEVHYPSRYPEVERIDDAEIERLTRAFARNELNMPTSIREPDKSLIKPKPLPPILEANRAQPMAPAEQKSAPAAAAPAVAPSTSPAANGLNHPKTVRTATAILDPEPPANPIKIWAQAPAPARVSGAVSGPAVTVLPGVDAKAVPQYLHSSPKAAVQEANKKAIDAAIAARKVSPPAAGQKSPVDDFVEAEILLRQKIEAGQKWSTFKAEAWRLYERFPRPDTAARLVELSLMYGSAIELEEVLTYLNRQAIEYYLLLQGQTRTHTLTKLWQAKRHDFLDQFLFRKDMLLELIPFERWYCVWSLIDRSQGDQAFKWFKRNDSELWNVQKQYGSVFHKSETEFAYALGQSALKAEEEALAIRLLETIPQSAPEFSRAIDVLLDLKIERDDKGYCIYGQKLSRELDWKARVGLFDSFLLRIQRLEHLAPKDRAALNALLADPLRWFPETPEAWQIVSEMLLQFSGLEKILPNILKTFADRATHYFKPAFEHSLWAPVLDHDFRNPVKTWYWRAVALLHEFGWGVGQDEKKLWDARRFYHEALAHHGKPLLHSWQQLHRGLTQWISKSERLDEALRVRLLLMIKLCGETRDLSEADVLAYLQHVQEPGTEVLATLETMARERQQWSLELFVQGRRAAIFHHTNQSLNRVWELGFFLKKTDLSWRAATLIQARQVLSADVETHWSICGEKRRDFPILLLKDNHLKSIFECFEGYERRLVESLVSIGPLVPELLAGLNEHLVPLKKGKPLTNHEAAVQDSLDKMSWLIPARKSYSPNPNGLWQAKPIFFSNLVDSKWSLTFVALAQRLGITAWEWQLSLLSQQIETLVPRMSRTSDSVAAGKVGRWLRALTPQQRKAWYELAQMSKRFDDLKGQEILGRFLVILATTIHQDHGGALHNLERMRAPLRLRWDLENWITSDVYGELRKSLGSQAVGHFPDYIYRLPAVAQEAAKTKPIA